MIESMKDWERPGSAFYVDLTKVESNLLAITFFLLECIENKHNLEPSTIANILRGETDKARDKILKLKPVPKTTHDPPYEIKTFSGPQTWENPKSFILKDPKPDIFYGNPYQIRLIYKNLNHCLKKDEECQLMEDLTKCLRNLKYTEPDSDTIAPIVIDLKKRMCKENKEFEDCIRCAILKMYDYNKDFKQEIKLIGWYELNY